MYVITIPEIRDSETEKKFEKIMAVNLPKVMTDIKPQIQ